MEELMRGSNEVWKSSWGDRTRYGRAHEGIERGITQIFTSVFTQVSPTKTSSYHCHWLSIKYKLALQQETIWWEVHKRKQSKLNSSICHPDEHYLIPHISYKKPSILLTQKIESSKLRKESCEKSPKTTILTTLPILITWT